MLHKQKSRKTSILKYGLFVPLFGLTLILSSATIRKNESIRVAAENIPLDQPLKVVSDALPTIPSKLSTHQATVALKGDTVNPNWVGFYAFLASKLSYPKAAEQAFLQGNSRVSFSIQDGAIHGLEAFTKLGMGCDEQVMQKILAFPNFKNMNDGKYILTVAFKLNGSTTSPVNAELPLASGYTPLNQLVVTGYPQEEKTAETTQEKIYDFTSVDTPPSFPGGIEKFYAYLGRSIKYPEEAKANKVQGKVFVSFIVEKDGKLSQIHVDRPLGSGTDEEAVRVLEQSPRWSAGLKDKQPLRVMYHIPISFTLSNPSSGDQSQIPATALYIIDGKDATAEEVKKLDAKMIESINVIKASKQPTKEGKMIKNDVIIVKTKAAQVSTTNN